MRCVNCERDHGEFLKTAYGDFLCEDCWDDYINTDVGRLEYLIGICNGDYPASEFDAEFLCEVAKSWMIHYNMLDFTPQQIAEFETKAKELGIL